MTKTIQWEKVFNQVLSRARAESKSVFSDFFNPHQTARFGEAEELMSSLETGIGRMHSDSDDLKKAYEDLRKEYSELMD